MFAVFRPRPVVAAARGIAIAAAFSGLFACSNGGITAGYNETTPNNDYDAEAMAAADIKKVVIAHVNLGPPSRRYLEKEADRVDEFVIERLESIGLEVMPQREFSQRWNNATLTYGDPIDPTLGRVNTNTFVQIIQTVREQMLEQTDVDAFIFTDLLEREVAYNQGVQRFVRWDGVLRKPQLQGPGQGVSTAFDWNVPTTTASIRIVVYNRDLQKVYEGVGGIDTTQAIDSRKDAFVRRRDMLDNENFIKEGISLALHPWIPMKNWPGNNPNAD